MCIDNETGYVQAMVGGRKQDFAGYTLNRAYQSFRQPGSAIKPLLVYTPLFEQNYRRRVWLWTSRSRMDQETQTALI